MKLFYFIISAILPFITIAQDQQNPTLSLKEIMQGDEFIGHQPENISWSIDGQQIYFEWNPDNNPVFSEYYYDLKNQEIVAFDSTNYTDKIPNPTGNYNDIEIYTKDGNLYQYNRKKKKEECIFITNDYCTNLQRWGEKVFFQIDDNFYCFNISENSIHQILTFKKTSKPKESEKNYLEQQEYDHFVFLREMEDRSEFRKKNAFSYQAKTPNIYTEGKGYSNVQIDKSGQFVFYRVSIPADAKGTNVPNYIGANGHVESISARPKVSDSDPNCELYIYDLEADKTTRVDFSTLSDIRKKPEYYAEYGDKKLEFDHDRNIIMHKIMWSPDGLSNILDVRSYDNKDRWLVSVNLNTGAITEIEHQHDEAWIGGPGISSWNMVSGTLGWIDNQTVYFQSESTGYSHLYSYNLAKSNKTSLTEGNWEVHNVELSKDKSTFYITANKTHPGNRGFYHLDIASKKLVPILDKPGYFDVVISPDESKLAVRYSYRNQPWELFKCENKVNPNLEQITTSTSEKFKQYTWYNPEVISFEASDGTDVYARVYKPDTDLKNKAAVIFVHGAGYLQNAHNYWSGYHREYMFHNLLRDLGFTVLDIDYRASAGYGRDYRTAIYRHMGGKDLSDQLDGKRYLVDSLGIDPERVGIYGGSYGGFITLMALLTEPGEFACGAALRSVTDWNHYNHEYTSNILNYPTTDSLAYYRSSPINFAQNLEDPLVMLHGMVDDNVQFQDVVRLSQKFIELGKEEWELAVFPVEAHGFKRSDSWTDEYRRILKIFLDNLIEVK